MLQRHRLEWPSVQLSECCTIVSGGTPKSSEAKYWGGEILWATPKDLTELASKHISGTPRTITETGLAKSSATMLPAQSVLFSSRAPIGHVAINTVPMCTNQGFKSFVPDPTQVFADYLYYWLRAHKVQLQSLGNGATFKEISKNVISKVELPLPPLPEQRRIAAILDKADALRQKRREAIAKLDQLLESVFLEVFGDPVTNPKGWKTRLVSECCERVTVGIVVKPASYYVDNGVPALRSINVGSGQIIRNNLIEIDRVAHETKLSKTILHEGDVIVVRSGQPGRAAIVPKNLNGANAIDLLIATPDKRIITAQYLSAVLNSAAGKRLVLTEQRGQVQKHLNVKQLADAQLPMPPMPEQLRFSRILSAVEAEKEKVLFSEARIEALNRAIQQRAFAGQL